MGLCFVKLSQQLANETKSESFLRSAFVVDGLCADLDPSCIGYRADLDKFDNSVLTKENETRIIEYCQSLVEKLKATGVYVFSYFRSLFIQFTSNFNKNFKLRSECEK